MQSFYRRFVEMATRYPDHVAVELQRISSSSEPDERYSYGELRTIAEHVGAWLQSTGIPTGARCAILAGNSPRWVAAYLGVMAAGCVAVPLDTAFKAEQVAKLLKDSGATLLFVDANHLQTAVAAWDELHEPTSNVTRELRFASSPIFVIDSSHDPRFADLDTVLSQSVPPFVDPAGSSDDIAVLLYTSGTTSDPKGVMLTHGNLNAEADGVFNVLRIGVTDALLGVLPLFHALAQMANLLLPLSVGARVVYLETLNTTELLRALEQRDITLFVCVPQFFYLIHERVMKRVESSGRAARVIFRLLLRLGRMGQMLGLNPGKVFFAEAHRRLGTKMRYLITGGSRFDRKIGRDLQDMGFDVLQAYGLTETSGGACLTRPRENVLGSVGKPLPGNEVRIDKSTDRAESSDGEIQIRGPIVMKGYYNRPDATAEILKDGWLHTGDLGYLDSRGNIFVTGRSKDVIVLSNGKNIYPEEIEAHYLQSPFIKEICVLGLESRPGEPLAERLHAVIVPDFEQLRERKIVNAREVIRFDVEGLSAQLPGTKRVLSYDIWQEDLPRTTTRKLKRFEIRRRVLDHSGADLNAKAQALSAQREFMEEDRLWLASAGVQQAMPALRAASKKDGEIHPSDNLELDLGLDSMERVELVVALEAALDAHVEDSELATVYSVRELVDVLLQHRGLSPGGPSRTGWQSVFASETTDPEVMKTLQPSALATIFWFAMVRLVRYLCQALYRIQISGLEKIPQDKPFILSPNHQSFMDAPLILSYFPYRIFRKMFYVGTSEIFGQGIRRRIARSVKLVPIDPDANLVPAMRAGAYGLRHGDALVLYPEGERSITGEPRTFKKGAAILATHVQVPIVPVAIDGFEKAWGRGRGIRLFQRLQIRIGDPIKPPAETRASEKVYETLTRDIKQRVVEMWNELHGERSVSEEVVLQG